MKKFDRIQEQQQQGKRKRLNQEQSDELRAPEAKRRNTDTAAQFQPVNYRNDWLQVLQKNFDLKLNII